MPTSSTPAARAAVQDQQVLKFKVAPHLVQDLGLNLYTNLAKVLVEFIANAYDADSQSANILMDFDDIEYQRTILKAQLPKGL